MRSDFVWMLGMCLAPLTLAAQPSPASIVTHPLPIRAYSTFDSSANVYMIGEASSAAGVTPGAAQTTPGGGGSCFYTPAGPAPCTDAFIVKADPSGNKVWATLLGGPTEDFGQAVTTDAAGNIYVIGGTGGSFPTTRDAAIPVSSTSVTFAAKISADGSTFLYSTYLPDSLKTLSAITVDAEGNAYVDGQTASGHAEIVKINPLGSSFIYSIALEGSNRESASAIVADASGNAYVVGSTSSPDFPVTGGVLGPQLVGAQNAFVTSLDPNGKILASTFLGGSGSDKGLYIQLDASGYVYVSGAAGSLDFPTTFGTFQPAPLVPAYSTTPGGFIAKLASDLSAIAWATYLWDDANPPLTLAASGDIYFTGGAAAQFPVTPSGPIQCVPGNFDDAGGAVLGHLDPHGALLDATYLLEDNPQSMLINPDASVLLAGDQVSDIRFGAPGWIAPPCMTLSVFNSARLALAIPEPGEFVSFLGLGIGPEQGVGTSELTTDLAGVQVLFDGNPAPVLYAQSKLVNAQVPFELVGHTSTSVMLQYNGASYGPITVPVRFADPALFRLEPGVSAQAYAVNQDGTVNGPSNPAPRGSIVALWANGLGALSPKCSTGGLNAPNPVYLAANLSVTMATSAGAANVPYAGGAPTLGCGISQINMQVPVTATPGPMTLVPTVVLSPPDGPTMSVGADGYASIIYVK
jgi:uncharacterized protein (TIGR03437 family)